ERPVLDPARQVPEQARAHVEAELVAVARVGHGLRGLRDMQAEVEGVPAEDVLHVGAAHDDDLATGLVADRLDPGRRHLARGPDGETVPGDEKGLARENTAAEVGHEIPEGPGLPALVEPLEALRD